MSHPPVVRVALVGCGAVSQRYYAPALQELARHRLLHVSALYDPEPRNVTRIEQSFPGAYRAGDLAGLPTQQIDLAIVASPPRYHADQTITLLRSGLSVLCEKPMATSVTEAEAMIEAAGSAPGILAIGLFRRFFPAAQTIHRIISLGVLGELISVTCSEGRPFRWPVQSPTYFSRATANGGVLMDIGVHVLDLLLWWLGQPEIILYEDDAMGGIEANCRLRCRWPGGTTGEIRLSRDCELPNRYVFRGTRGRLSWNVDDVEGLELMLAESSLGLRAMIHTLDERSALPALGRPADNFQQSFIAQIRNVVAAVHGTEPLRVPGEEGILSLGLIEASYLRRTLMPMPWLGEDEQARARRLNHDRYERGAPAVGPGGGTP
jgi:predicted dehydrogenase